MSAPEITLKLTPESSRALLEALRQANDLEPQQWLTVPQYAEQMGMTKQAIYKLIERGAIPHKRVGRSVRIPASEVQ